MFNHVSLSWRSLISIGSSRFSHLVACSKKSVYLYLYYSFAGGRKKTCQFAEYKNHVKFGEKCKNVTSISRLIFNELRNVWFSVFEFISSVSFCEWLRSHQMQIRNKKKIILHCKWNGRYSNEFHFMFDFLPRAQRNQIEWRRTKVIFLLFIKTTHS